MNTNRNAIIAAVITFIIGILFGYSLNGGDADKKADPKELLNRAILGIEKLQKENQSLKADLKGVQKDSPGRGEKAMKEELKKTRQDNEDLKSQIASLREQLNKSAGKAKSAGESASLIENMKKRIAALEKENHDLNRVVDDISSLTGQEKVTAPEQPR